MNSRLPLYATTLSLLFSNNLYAQTRQETDDLGAVVVTATRQAARANELLSDISVINREEIENANPMQTLGELLAYHGGVDFTTQGAPGNTSNVFIRGTASTHTLLLVDGMRVGSATTGGPSISAIPLSQIERVEILKGSASSLYGSDAIGGVIQVFTRKGEGKPRVEAEISTGTHNTKEGYVGVSGKTNDIRYSFRAGGANSHGYNIINNPSHSYYNKDKDGYQNQSASAQVSIDIAPGHELGFQGIYSRYKNRYDSAYYSNPNYDFRSISSAESYAIYSKNRFTSKWTSQIRLGRSIDNSKSYRAPDLTNQFKTNQDQFVWQNDISLPTGSLLLATEYLRQSIDTTSKYQESSRIIRSALAGWTGNYKDHRLQLNIRNDDNSQFGNKTTGGISYGYQINDYWRIRGGFSTGFKAPSFNDLYYPGSGNSRLKPESSRNREIGLNYESAQTNASLTIYQNNIEDMIQWAPGSGGIWTPENIGKAKITGGTLSGGHRINNLTLRASLDILSPKDKELGKYLQRRTRKNATIGFDHIMGRFSWGADLLAAGMRYENPANTEKLRGYATLALRAAYKIDNDLKLFAKAGNFFDKKYELAKDYASPGATFFVGIRYQPQ